MVNLNGTLLSGASPSLTADNRGFLYGDAVFETIKHTGQKALFLEDHYFRLMASMRIFGMEIPLEFTLDFFEQEFLRTIKGQSVTAPAWRVRLTVYRAEGGRYMPVNNNVNFLIQSEPLDQLKYPQPNDNYVVDLYKDFYVQASMLSNLKSNNKALQVLGSVFAQRQDLQNCILINDRKEVTEALNGNIFLVFGNELHTPPLNSGCLDGIMRKQLMAMADKLSLKVEERAITPFELQRADELWVTNTITGITPVVQYRRKTYQNQVAIKALDLLNTFVA
ncbi:MAG: aminotransferase class IV [Flavobacteriaceae bacterium]|nr:aminotransferase class IV [Flavobacteriaceae bacterium]